MGTTVVVLDTNQFRSSPMLRNADWKYLIERADAWDLRFVVPEVCFLEAVDVVRRMWLDRRREVAKLAVGQFGLADSQERWLNTIDEQIGGYETSLRARLAEVGAEIVPIPESLTFSDVVQRAIARRRPYPDGEGKKDGFRDTLIWLSTVTQFPRGSRHVIPHVRVLLW